MRQRGEMRRGDMAIMILDEMQMFDQKIAAARPVGQQRLHVAQSGRIDLTALRRAPGLAAAGAFAFAATMAIAAALRRLAIAAGLRRIVHVHCDLPGRSF